MKYSEIITLALQFAITVLVGVIAPAVRNWLEQKTDNERLNRVKGFAYTAVCAAEQVYRRASNRDPDGEKRKHYARVAILQMADHCGLKLTDKEIDALIEAAVLALKTENACPGGVLTAQEGETARATY